MYWDDHTRPVEVKLKSIDELASYYLNKGGKVNLDFVIHFCENAAFGGYDPAKCRLEWLYSRKEDTAKSIF